MARARALKAALAGTRVPLLVNDRVDVALAAQADGVHLGQDDMHAADARRLLGPEAIVGLTIKTAAQADELYRLPVDYACIGGVFRDRAARTTPNPRSGSTASRASPSGRGLPAASSRSAPSPASTTRNAAAVIAAGADGVAVISAIFAADDVAAAARRLRAIVDQALAARGAL